MLKSSWVFLSGSDESPSSRSSPYEFPDFAREAPVLRGFPYENLNVYPGNFPTCLFQHRRSRNLAVFGGTGLHQSFSCWFQAAELVKDVSVELEDVQATLRMAQVETHGTDHVQKRIPNIHEQEKNTTDQYIYIFIHYFCWNIRYLYVSRI